MGMNFLRPFKVANTKYFRFFTNVFVFVTLIFLISCVASESDDEANCDETETFNSRTRACENSNTGIAPEVTSSKIRITEDIVTTININYRNTPANVRATDCDFDSAGVDGIAEASACSCPGGDCSIDLVTLPNRTIKGSVRIRLRDIDGVFGPYKFIPVDITPANDIPTLCPVTTAANDLLDNAACGGLDCIGGGNPGTPFTLGVTPDFTTDSTPTNTGEKYFYDSLNDVCYQASIGTAVWNALNGPGFPTKCDYSEDVAGEQALSPATDCAGGDGDDCVGAADPGTNDAPAGTVYFNEVTGGCFVFSTNSNSWVAIGDKDEHVISVLEDSLDNIGTDKFLAGYDADGDVLTKSYAAVSSNAGNFLACTNGADNCFYDVSSNENFNFDGSAAIADQTDSLTYTLTDGSAASDSITVVTVVRAVNDAPLITNIVKTNLVEGTDVTDIDLTISTTASASTIQEIDNVTLQSFTLVNVGGVDDCSGARTDLDDTGLADNVYICDIPAKGLFRAYITGGDNAFPLDNTETLEIDFHPNPNFNGTAQVQMTVTDPEGSTSNTGTVFLSYDETLDAPTFCPFVTNAVDAADGGYCGNIDCISSIDPDTLSDADGTPTNEFQFLDATDPNFISAIYSSGAPDATRSGIYFHQGTGCLYSENGTDTWEDLQNYNCPFSETKADCGGGNCTAAGTGDANFPAPAFDGLVYWNTNSPFACYISSGGNWIEVTTAGENWILRTTESEDGATQLTFNQGNSATDLPDAQDIDIILGNTSDTLTYTFSNPSNGELMGCDEGDNQTGAGPFNNCTGFLPTQFFSGNAGFEYTATDSGANAETINIVVAVEEVDSSPNLTYQDDSALDGTTINANEGSIIQLYDLLINESSVKTDSSEDDQDLLITITSSNSSVLSTGNVSFFWEDSGEEFSFDKNLTTATGAAQGLIDKNAVAEDTTNDAASKVFGLRLVTTPGNSGTTNVSITIDDQGTSTDTTITFTVVVNSVGVVHGGWDNIHSVGPLIRKSADYRECDEAGEFTATFTGTDNPNDDTVTFDPTVIGNVYQETDREICYESNGTDWLPRGCDYATAAEAGTNCNSGDCYGSGAPSFNSPTTSGLRYLDITNNICYTSISGSGWFPEGSYTYLAWDDFTITGSTISGWKVFRRQLDQEFDFSTPVATISGNSSALRKLWDVIPSEESDKGYTYRYMVLPFDASSNSALVFPQESYREVGVILPPFNQVFVHRRVINKEVCLKLGQTPIKTDDNSCAYDGAGGVDVDGDDVIDTYKQSTNFLVDRYEFGCDYTTAVNEASTACTDGSPCLGNTTPTGVADTSEVFYERDLAVCYLEEGAAWTAASGIAGLDAAFDQEVYKGNLADLPPLVNVDQNTAHTICEARGGTNNIIIEKYSTSGGLTGTIVGDDYGIPSRSQFIALAAWDDDDTTLSDSDINSLETGSDLDISSKCNSTDANGIESQFTDSEVPLSAFKHTTPGTASSSIRQLSSGSDFTNSCVSKYSIQDLVGNVREWNGERFAASMQGVQSSTLDPRFDLDDGDESTYAMDGASTTNLNLTGPDLSTDGDYTWVLANKENSATRFDLPMGLPIDQAGTPNFQIGQTSGITTAQLHSDDISVNANSLVVTGISSGGSHNAGSGAGRYKADIIDIDSEDTETGFRCVFPVPVSYTQ